MSHTTARIASNVRTHGIAFAVEHEVKRAQRAGRGREAAITTGIEHVASVIRMIRRGQA